MKSFIASSLIFVVAAASQHCAHEYEFNGDPPRHSITQIAPVCGRTGDTITITGKNFSGITSQNIVMFNGVRATVLLASPTYLTAIVPSHAGTGSVSVVMDKTQATGPSFTYLPNGVVTIASASLAYINGLAADAQKNIYMARGQMHRIDKRSATGVLSVVAGGGRAGNTDGYFDGYGTSALFSYPSDVAVDSKGNIYVSDTGNNCIRMIAPDGYVSLYAGVYNNQYPSPLPGFRDGPRNQAMFDSPAGLFMDQEDNLYVCDAGNVRIRMITPDGGDSVGYVTTIAGTGQHGNKNGPALQATFSFVRDLVVDNNGNIFLTEAYEPARVRKISNGVVSTLIDSPDIFYRGCGGEPYRIYSTEGIALGPEGNVYCSVYNSPTDDYLDDRAKIVTLAPDGTISTLAGGANANGPREGIGTNVYLPVTGNLLMVDGALYAASQFELLRVDQN